MKEQRKMMNGERVSLVVELGASAGGEVRARRRRRKTGLASWLALACCCCTAKFSSTAHLTL